MAKDAKEGAKALHNSARTVSFVLLSFGFLLAFFWLSLVTLFWSVARARPSRFVLCRIHDSRFVIEYSFNVNTTITNTNREYLSHGRLFSPVSSLY